MKGPTSQQGHALDRCAAIFAIIKAAANAGEECPSNAVLAERTGCRSQASASDAISFLETAGMIRVQRRSNARVVTICATGKSTAPRAILKGRLSAAERINAFADRLAANMTVKAAGEAVGVSETRAHVYLSRIKAGLGWQAQ